MLLLLLQRGGRRKQQEEALDKGRRRKREKEEMLVHSSLRIDISYSRVKTVNWRREGSCFFYFLRKKEM